MNNLFHNHEQSLLQKHITDDVQLALALRYDFEKIHHALIELQTVNADEIVHDFFSEHPSSVPEILANVTDHQLNHVGFEIYAPLDVIFHQLDEWLARLSEMFKTPVRINRQLRFPASQSFQQRVNAGVEIFCLWLDINGHILMVELFDIARSISAVLPDSALPDHYDHRQAMNHLFHNDKIWHYSVHVENQGIVEQLHHEFQALVSEQSFYKLAYLAPIQNRYDGSFHTKLINLTRGLELEFVTQHTK